MEKETLEEFINQSNTPEGLDQFSYDKGLKDGAKWQQERMYSEEDMLRFGAFMQQRHTGVKESFEEFKKKQHE